MKKKAQQRTKGTLSVATPSKVDYARLLGAVSKLLEEGRRAAARSVNLLVTATYGKLGRHLVEFEQVGRDRAVYGDALLARVSADLTTRLGRGFSPENLRLMRLFYLRYRERISQTLSGESALPARADKSPTLSGKAPLSWSHYVRLLGVGEPVKRDFYEEDARRAGWSVRQLLIDRQMNSPLYKRLALPREKGKLLDRAERAGERAPVHDEIKPAYILWAYPSPTPRRTWKPRSSTAWQISCWSCVTASLSSRARSAGRSAGSRTALTFSCAIAGSAAWSGLISRSAHVPAGLRELPPSQGSQPGPDFRPAHLREGRQVPRPDQGYRHFRE